MHVALDAEKMRVTSRVVISTSFVFLLAELRPRYVCARRDARCCGTKTVSPTLITFHQVLSMVLRKIQRVLESSLLTLAGEYLSYETIRSLQI
jgi:hypothetical protein